MQIIFDMIYVVESPSYLLKIWSHEKNAFHCQVPFHIDGKRARFNI